MAQVESKKSCPKEWKLRQAQVPFQLETGSPGREGGGKARARTRKTCSHQPGIHITHTALKQVRFALVSNQRWPNCLRTLLSSEQFQAPVCLFTVSLPLCPPTHHQCKAFPGI